MKTPNLLGENTHIVDLDPVIQELLDAPKRQPYTTAMTHRIPIEVLKELQNLSKTHDVSQGMIVASALKVFLEVLKDTTPRKPVDGEEQAEDGSTACAVA